MATVAPIALAALLAAEAIAIATLLLMAMPPTGKVKLEDVKTLYIDIRGNRTPWKTNSRRGDREPKMHCLGGSANCWVLPGLVTCHNKGQENGYIHWDCDPNMENYRFGQVSVACEGYDYPGDPYVLLESCGVKYTLEYAGNRSTYGGNDLGNWNTLRQRLDLYFQGMGIFGSARIIILAYLAFSILYQLYKLYWRHFGPQPSHRCLPWTEVGGASGDCTAKQGNVPKPDVEWTEEGARKRLARFMSRKNLERTDCDDQYIYTPKSSRSSSPIGRLPINVVTVMTIDSASG